MRFDVAIVGAGAAGLHCAALAGQHGLSVLLVDHAVKVAEKIRISGGGRCNFTNRDVGPAHFFSANPDYCRSALARYTPADFIALVEAHGIAWHEKHRGQLFCDGSSQQIIDLLLHECAEARVVHWQPCAVREVAHRDAEFVLGTERGEVSAAALVVASGGLSIPKIGASDWGHVMARRFGHRIVEPRPALVPLVVGVERWAPFSALAGVSLPARVETPRVAFDDDLLVTHRGLSGPAALQASSDWRPGEPVTIDLAPAANLEALLGIGKSASRRLLPTLAEQLPRRFIDAWLAAEGGPIDGARERPLSEWRDRELADLARRLHAWRVLPSGTEGYAKAEVTAGGVDTRELDSRSGESRRQRGLYFIGEVVDVTGWLGGYNFQWAWASAAACARALAPVCRGSAAPL